MISCGLDYIVDLTEGDLTFLAGRCSSRTVTCLAVAYISVIKKRIKNVLYAIVDAR